MLIGAGIFFNLNCMEKIYLSERFPTLQNTKLGWIVSGGLANEGKRGYGTATSVKSNTTKTEDKCLTEAVKRFWEIQNCYSSDISLTNEDILCERLFQEIVTRLESGKYSARLLNSTGFGALNDSFGLALRILRV